MLNTNIIIESTSTVTSFGTRIGNNLSPEERIDLLNKDILLMQDKMNIRETRNSHIRDEDTMSIFLEDWNIVLQLVPTVVRENQDLEWSCWTEEGKEVNILDLLSYIEKENETRNVEFRLHAPWGLKYRQVTAYFHPHTGWRVVTQKSVDPWKTEYELWGNQEKIIEILSGFLTGWESEVEDKFKEVEW